MICQRASRCKSKRDRAAAMHRYAIKQRVFAGESLLLWDMYEVEVFFACG